MVAPAWWGGAAGGAEETLAEDRRGDVSHPSPRSFISTLMLDDGYPGVHKP